MDVVHVSGDEAVFKRVRHPVAFILVNHRKDFATFYDTPQSRYEGFFVSHGDTFIKTLSRVIRRAAPDTLEFYHDEQVAARRYGVHPELYSLADDDPVLVYESKARDEFVVRLDVRDQFHIPQWGRDYGFYERAGAVVVSYRDDRITETVFLAIRHDGEFHPLGSWQPVDYDRDRERNSHPTTLYEYELGRFACKKLVVAFGTSPEAALTLAERSADESNLSRVLKKKAKPKRVQKGGDAAAQRIAAAGAQDALTALSTADSVLAGMPWFTKAWVRDELLSLPALPKAKAHAIVEKYLHAEWEDGRLPVIFGGANCCSDGLGLLAWAVLFSRLTLTDEEKQRLAFQLLRAIDALEATENEHGFIPSWERESWMDSIERTGYPVETQALYSKILHLGQLLTDSDYYEEKRHALLKNIRTHYFHDGYLHDRLGDETMRPNVFLSAFFAPEILCKAEWESCFDRVLPALWLDWGGLASIERGHGCFCDVSTGERDTSYHCGDSWFFVNNIAALVLHNINAAKYASYISAILEASTEEILWHNYIGRPGEISSARALESWGCGLQGFSAAAYLYLVRQVPIRRRSLGTLFAQPPRWQRKLSLQSGIRGVRPGPPA